MTKYKTIENLMILADRNETFRINERISLPSGNPTIEKIIWSDVKIRKLTTKMLEGMIHLSGQLKVFIMYTPEEQSIPVQWFDTVIDFSGTLEAPEAREDLISYICGDIHNVELEATMNQDNEMKDLDISALLKLSIKIYEENKMDVLEDIYAPDVDLCPMEKEQKYEKLLVKNESRTKNIIKIDVDQSKGHILQICNSDTRLQIDNISVGENNLRVTGKIRATIIYISSDDIYSICCQTKETDFEHRIDTEGISKDDKYYINWKVEQVSSNMISTNQVEVKSVIALQAMVFKEEKCNFVWDIEEKPIDWAKFNDAPILKGYIVRKGDTLWKLAKANYTTVDNIMKINQLENEKIREGDKLLLVKNCQ